jgi:hypothetical protein
MGDGNEYQRARRAIQDYHRLIVTKEAWFCICGDPDSYGFVAGPAIYWEPWNKHYLAKMQEARKRLYVYP